MSSIGTLSLIVVSGLLLLSCGDTRDDGGSSDHAAEVEQTSHDHSSVSVEGLVLNGDVKWEVDAHTRSMFTKMAASFGEGVHEPDRSGSLAATGEKMRAEIDELIRGCTMTGEAHDQLHNYLMAYIPAVERLAHVGEQAQADSVGLLLELYPTYFE